MEWIDRFNPFSETPEPKTALAVLTKGLIPPLPIQISSDSHWLQKIPGLSQEYQKYLAGVEKAEDVSPMQFLPRFFIYEYLTQPLEFADLLKLPKEKIDPLELIFRQHRLAYPSRGYYTVHSPQSACLWGIFAQPDFNQASRTDYSTDPAVNTFLALHLATNPEIKSMITGPKALVELATTEGISVDFGALWIGFADLTAKPVMKLLINGGVIPFDGLDKFYQEVSESYLAVSQYMLRQLPEYPDSKVIFPYPYHQIDIDQYPRIDYLKYIGSTLISYIRDLPECIPSGRQFTHGLLIEGYKAFYDFADRTLKAHTARKLIKSGVPLGTLGVEQPLGIFLKEASQSDPNLTREVASIAKDLVGLKPTFLKLFALYRDNPGLLNRRDPKDLNPTNFPGYYTVRQEILDYGGRAPKKPLHFDIDNATKHRQI